PLLQSGRVRTQQDAERLRIRAGGWDLHGAAAGLVGPVREASRRDRRPGPREGVVQRRRSRRSERHEATLNATGLRRVARFGIGRAAGAGSGWRRSFVRRGPRPPSWSPAVLAPEPFTLPPLPHEGLSLL